MFCYARDNAIPLSSWWTKMNDRTQSPLNAVHCVSFLTLLLGLPMLGNEVRGEISTGGRKHKLYHNLMLMAATEVILWCH